MKIKFHLLLLLVVLISPSCQKYLDKTPDKKLAVPKTIKDLQALLDNNTMTQSGIGLNDLGSDDHYFLTEAERQSKSQIIRNCYTWEKDIFQGLTPSDWTGPYQQIYICNVVLEELAKINKTAINENEWNFAKGHALFCRAFHFYLLSETFGYPFNPTSATTDMGIPLRLTANLEEKITRATVKQTFDQIISDLEAAKDLLPDQVDINHRNRPSKAAVFALMARAYLIIQDYDNANLNANKSLALYDTLVDYNNSNAAGIFSNGSASRPFPAPFNDFVEIIYQSLQNNYGYFSSNTNNVDTNLLKLYNANDLRLLVFYAKQTTSTRKYFRGQYSGLTSSFCGLATDEVYLIRAESFARKGNITAAMQDLNALYKKRWLKTVPYVQLTAADANDALQQILKERRKELVIRGLRWSDLRRLNQNPQTAATLTRNLDGQVYTLAPNSPRYVYPIPDIEIQLSGIPQNPR